MNDYNEILLFDENGELLGEENITEKSKNQLLAKFYELKKSIQYETVKVAFTLNGYVLNTGKHKNNIRSITDDDKQLLGELLSEE